MPIQEAVLIVPASAASHAVHAATTQFGGCTHWPVHDTWIDEKTGEVIAEPNERIVIAAAGTGFDYDKLRLIAESVGMLAKQQCVYLQDWTGNVKFVPTAHLWKSADVA